MSHYKKNDSSNRDALFGPSSGASSTSNDTGAGGQGGRPRTRTPQQPSSAAAVDPGTGTGSGWTPRRQPPPSPSQLSPPQQQQTHHQGYSGNGHNQGAFSSALKTATSSSSSSGLNSASASAGGSRKAFTVSVSEDVRSAKLKEAEHYKSKAKAAMSTGLMKRPDPLVACTYYKRAADCYKALGDRENERYYRVSSAQCNVQIGAWASAASDFTLAADLIMAKPSRDRQALSEQECFDASSYHQQASDAWRNQGDTAKAAQSQISAAVTLNSASKGSLLSKTSLAGMEEAVEAHVPDVLNPFARYRQMGHSSFVDPNSENESVEHPSAETLAMAQEHLVSRAYAHEPLQKLVHMLAGYGEYASALYAQGAVSTLLSSDNISTLSLSRSYVMETILQLAMGDPVAAEQSFLNRHCNSRFYLTSREAQLAEELMRAIQRRDIDALDLARSPSGPNRTALANLDANVRTVVSQLRVSGVARKQVPDRHSNISSSEDDSNLPTLQELLTKKTGYEEDFQQGAKLNAEKLAAELDDLNFGDDKSDDDSNDEQDKTTTSLNNNDNSEKEDDDDDDFDLR